MRHKNIESKKHEQELYARAEILSRRLKIPFIEPILRVTLIRADGSRELMVDGHSRSYTRNFYNKMLASIGGWAVSTGGYVDGSIEPKDTGGVLRSSSDLARFDDSMDDSHFAADAGVTAHGIQIGTGTTAESFDDYQIETQIADGAGVGEMEYSKVEHVEDWDVGGSYIYHNMERLFSNDSAGSITVNESTLVWENNLNYYKFCMIRDKFSSGIAVASGEALAVFYELRLLYP